MATHVLESFFLYLSLSLYVLEPLSIKLLLIIFLLGIFVLGVIISQNASPFGQQYILIMKIIDWYYVLTILATLIGVPILVYMKLGNLVEKPYHIAIYGQTIDATMLGYYINMQMQQLTFYQNFQLNITFISPPQIKIDEDIRKREMNKKIFSFCGVERELMQLLQTTNLKYSIKEYGIYFGQVIQNLESTSFKIYSLQSSPLSSIANYGLSNFAAQNFFYRFASALNNTNSKKKKYLLEQITTMSIISELMKGDVEAQSLKFFSQKQGLDQKYIKNYLTPVIWANYLHQANTASVLFKLLPVFCYKNPQIGKSLVLFQQSSVIKQKILQRILSIKVNFLNEYYLRNYEIITNQKKEKQVKITLNSQKMVSTVDFHYDMLFIFESNEKSASTKYISYYKTLIDGKIANDDKYQEFFTIYLKIANNPRPHNDIDDDLKKNKKQDLAFEKKGDNKNVGFNPIYSITRICAYNCKNYENSAYLLISKHKISSSSLLMFQKHNIVQYNKFYLPRSQMPQTKKIQESQNVFKIYDTDAISDSYEIKLNIVKEIAKATVFKIKKIKNLQNHLL